MRKISIYLIFTVIWVLAAVAVATFPDIMIPVAETLTLTLYEAIALFLILMVVLTMIFLVFIGREAGRSVAEYLL